VESQSINRDIMSTSSNNDKSGFLFRFFTSLPKYDHYVDVRTKDKLEIEIDCDNKFIGLTSEDTKKKFELLVNPKRYPLPWQIVFSLNRTRDGVRLHP
jgi:hypothetical protein